MQVQISVYITPELAKKLEGRNKSETVRKALQKYFEEEEIKMKERLESLFKRAWESLREHCSQKEWEYFAENGGQIGILEGEWAVVLRRYPKPIEEYDEFGEVISREYSSFEQIDDVAKTQTDDFYQGQIWIDIPGWASEIEEAWYDGEKVSC